MLEQETGNYFNSVSNLVETFFPADMELLNHTVDKLSPLPDTDEKGTLLRLWCEALKQAKEDIEYDNSRNRLEFLFQRFCYQGWDYIEDYQPLDF